MSNRKSFRAYSRTGVLAVATGLTVAIGSAADADLQGLLSESRTFEGTPGWPGGLTVWDFYAVFDDPDDELVQVTGSAMNPPPIVITTTDPDGFHNEPGSSTPDRPPSDDELGLAPSLNWDSYVTVGITSYGDPGNPIQLTPGFPDVDGTVITTDNGAWFVSPGTHLGRAGDYPDEQVLVARLVIRTAYTISFVGSVSYYDGGPPGVGVFTTVTLSRTTPEPNGACCLPDGSCDDAQTGGDCVAMGGSHQGDGVLCSAVDCGGACCLFDGSCTDDQTAEACALAEGIYQGPDVACNSSPCGGACCLFGGSCIEDTVPAVCSKAGGFFGGPDSTCAGFCFGACCLADGTCVDGLSSIGCDTAAGVFRGVGSMCATERCEGACCLQNGDCAEAQTLSECSGAGGVYQGLNVPCIFGANCSGACCLDTGTCIDGFDAGSCESFGGTWQGLGTLCADVTCPQPGACCQFDGFCAMAAETGGADCTSMGGIYQGDDTICARVTCPGGACCDVDGDCSVVAEEGFCLKGGGIWNGVGTDCGSVDCRGACCFDDGTCSDEDLKDCIGFGGTWLGTQATCSASVCPIGACCLTDDSCVIDSDIDCVTAGGAYRGGETTCEEVECPAAGLVITHQKISNLAGGLVGPLVDLSLFGSSIASIGDLDEDGVEDIAVGALEFSFPDEGSVWILFLNADGTVKSEVKITEGQNGFVGPLGGSDFFGIGVAALGDVDGDGVPDIAVGASQDNDGGDDRGAVWILFLNTDGTVKAEQKISSLAGGFLGALQDDDFFGTSVSAVDDLDGDGVVDIAVGAIGTDSVSPAGCVNDGSVWILFLNTDGTVHAHTHIDALSGETFCNDQFGRSVTGIDDLDGDGIGDLLVGSPNTSDAGGQTGAAWVLFLGSDGGVLAHQKISTAAGNFIGQVGVLDRFGISTTWLRDLDGDGVSDVAVGAFGDNDGGTDRGAVWILFLNPDGTVKDEQKISDLAGDFKGTLDDNDRLGFGLASIGDLDGDGVRELIAGAPGDDDAPPGPGMDFGALWLLYLQGIANIGFDDPQEFLADGEAIIHDSGDLDGDGDQDVIVVIPNPDPGLPGSVQVFINLGADGGGGWLGFEEPPLAPITVGLNPTDVVIGDVNGLGLLDAIVTNAGDGTISILLNNGTPLIFAAPVPFVVGELPQAIELDDFTPGAAPGPGGAQDAAIARETAGAAGDLIILENDGNGGFTQGEVAALGGPPKSMEPEDLDNDKNTDLVIGRRDDASIDVWLNGGAPGPSVITLPVGSPPADVAVADFDDDGFVDIATANTGGTVSILRNLGGGSFEPAFEVEVGSDPRSITAADFDIDSDIDPDLAVVADDPDIGPAVQVLENITDEESIAFGPPLALDFNADPNHVIAVDLNGDGAIDLVTANADNGGSGGSVTARINKPPAPECVGDTDGDGMVGFPDLLAVLAGWSPGPGSCVGCPEDLDGDGDVDFQDLLLVLALWGGCP